MGFIRVAISALALAVASAAARADDYGPHRGVREVRAAVPVLIHAGLSRLDRHPTFAVPDVVVIGDQAIARWTDGKRSGLASLAYRNATWWLMNAFERPPCDDERGDVVFPSSEMGEIVRQHIALPREHCDDAVQPGLIRSMSDANVFNVDGYLANWIADSPIHVSNIHGRAPDDAEMSGPGANSIFYVYANGGPTPLSAPKSTLTVWCPFVLDPSVHYIIEFAGADGRLGPIRGTLDDNTLTFEIPAFTAPANADLRGEVDYLPYREH